MPLLQSFWERGQGAGLPRLSRWESCLVLSDKAGKDLLAAEIY